MGLLKHGLRVLFFCELIMVLLRDQRHNLYNLRCGMFIRSKFDRTDLWAEIFITPRTSLLVEPALELVRIAREPIQDSAPYAVNLLHIAPLLRAELHNLFGLEPAMIEQIGQPPLTPVG